MQKTVASAVAVLTLGSMSLLCRSSIGSLASNSVHRRSSWTFQYAQRPGVFKRGFGGDVGLGIFRAPPGRPAVERQFSEPSIMKSSLSSRAPAQFVP